jgi:type I restriction enzyme, S subunit
MDVTSAYKQDKLDRFPKDWDILPLKSISSIHGRIGWQGLKQSEFTMNPDDPFLITGMNFDEGEIKWDEVYHIPQARYEEAKPIKLNTGDVLMTKDGTIGKILFIDYIPYPGKASLNSHLLVFRPLNNCYFPKY